MSYRPSNLEKMIETFLALDVNRDEIVDKNELHDACIRDEQNMDELKKFFERFDVDKDGKVTLAEFCRSLGLKQSEMRKERDERQLASEGHGRSVSPDIQIIATTMSPEKQAELTEKFKDFVGEVTKREDMDEVAKKMKDYLDEKHGRVWQSIILRGSYWMKFSHEPFQSMQFKYMDNICLIWRTPSGQPLYSGK